MKKPVIFFDWDGTLADSMGLSRAGVQTAFAEMGLPPCPEEMLHYSNGPTIPESAFLLGLPETLHEEYVTRRVAAEMRLLGEYQRLFPGVREMLARLAEIADLAIISNGVAPYLADSIRILGLEDTFACVQGLISGQKKGVTLGQVIERLQPERAVMVGDCAGDFVAGRMCALPTVAVSYGYGTPDDWAQADVTVDSAETLEAWLTAWAQG